MPNSSALDLQTIAALLGLAVPLVTALLVKHNAPSALKIIVNLVFAVVAAEVALLIQWQGHHITGWLFINTAMVALVSSWASYRAVYRPVNVKAHLAPNFGLGPSGNAPVVNK